MKSDLLHLSQEVSGKTLKCVQAYYDKYYLKEFESSTGETMEYREFIKDTKKALKAIFADTGFELVEFSKIHFSYSCFVLLMIFVRQINSEAVLIVFWSVKLNT